MLLTNIQMSMKTQGTNRNVAFKSKNMVHCEHSVKVESSLVVALKCYIHYFCL